MLHVRVLRDSNLFRHRPHPSHPRFQRKRYTGRNGERPPCASELSKPGDTRSPDGTDTLINQKARLAAERSAPPVVKRASGSKVLLGRGVPRNLRGGGFSESKSKSTSKSKKAAFGFLLVLLLLLLLLPCRCPPASGARCGKAGGAVWAARAPRYSSEGSDAVT